MSLVWLILWKLWGASVKRYDDVLEIDPRGVQNKPMPYGKINVFAHPIISTVVFLDVSVKQQ